MLYTMDESRDSGWVDACMAAVFMAERHKRDGYIDDVMTTDTMVP